jgi:hypothetical protein
MYAEIIHPQLPPMRRVGRTGQYHGPCPFCADGGENRFQVWMDADGGRPAGRYWCRVCNRRGLLKSLDRPGIAPSSPGLPKRQRQRSSGPRPKYIPHYRELYTATALWAHAWLLDGCHPEPLIYLRQRGLDDDSIARSVLGVTLRDPFALVEHLRTTCPTAFPYAEEAGVLVRDHHGQLRTHWNLCGALVFPVIAEGEVTDLRVRQVGSGHKAKSLAGGMTERGAHFPMGWDELAGSDTVLLTESGEFKTLVPQAAYHAGTLTYPTLGHPGLSTFRPEWGAALVANSIQTVILAYDSQPRPLRDGIAQLAPEEIATIRHGQALAAAGLAVRVLRLPLAPGETKADLDDFLLRYGSQRLQTLIDAAPLLADYHQSLPRPLLERANLPLPGSYPTRRARPRRVMELPPRPQEPDPIPLPQARAQLAAQVQTHATTGEGFLVLAHPPGVGKGYNTVVGLQAYLRQHPDPGHIVWAALRREQQHDQSGLPLIPLAGRNPTNCRKFPETQVLTRKGYPVRQTLCERRCIHVNHCRYLGQFGEEGDFFAPLPLLQATQWWADAGVLVLDEFDPVRLTHTVTLELPDLAAMARATDCPHAQAILRWLAQVIATTLDRTLTGVLLYQALAEVAAQEGVDFWATVRLAHAALPPAETAVLLPGFPHGATLNEYERLPPNHLHTLLSQIAKEGRKQLAGQPFTSRIEAHDGVVQLFLRHEHLIAQLARPDQPKLILDATANEALLRAIFPHTPLHVEQPAIAGTTQVVQVITRDWAKTTLYPQRREQWYDTVASHIRADRPTLVVCTLECEADLRQALDARGHADVKLAHYGAVRGSNTYRGHDVILAQVYHPNLEQVIREGRALFADDDQPLDPRIVLVDRPVSDRAGNQWLVPVPSFSDPRLAALLESRRENELVQAALRGRPLDHPEVQITLLFGLPLPGLTPTQIVEATHAPTSNQGRALTTEARLTAALHAHFAQGRNLISVQELADQAGVGVNTVRAHWATLAHRLKLRSTTQRRVITLPNGTRRSYARAVLIQRGRRAPPTPATPPHPTDQARTHDMINRPIYRVPRRIRQRSRVGQPRWFPRKRIWRPPK